MGAAYQVVMLTAAGSPFEAALVQTLERTLVAKLVQLGLSAGDVAFVDDAAAARGRFDGGLPTAAVYVSDSAGVAASAALAVVLARSVLTVPVVPDLARFGALMPPELRAVNGLAPRADDPGHDGIANRVLEELRLLRRNRRAFISYRRAESSGFAEALRVELERRRYQVFLDTFSVEYGVDFQSELWHQLANTDVVVLLNTATVFESAWVDEEITRATAAGIAVVQIIWPGVPRQRELELAEPHYLDAADVPGAVTAAPTAAAIERCATEVERIRARAQAARRHRVLSELKAACDRRGVQLTLELDGRVRLEGAASSIARLVPVVGCPDARLLQEQAERAPAPMLYDSLGLLATYRSHLAWLNQHLPATSVAVQEIDAWLTLKLL